MAFFSWGQAVEEFIDLFWLSDHFTCDDVNELK